MAVGVRTALVVSAFEEGFPVELERGTAVVGVGDRTALVVAFDGVVLVKMCGTTVVEFGERTVVAFDDVVLVVVSLTDDVEAAAGVVIPSTAYG